MPKLEPLPKKKDDAIRPYARALCFSENHLLTILICETTKKGAMEAARHCPSKMGQNSPFKIEMFLISVLASCSTAQHLSTDESLNLSKVQMAKRMDGMANSAKLMEHMLTKVSELSP